MRPRKFGRRAPIEIRRPRASADFGHRVPPMRAQALCAFSRPGAVCRLKSGRLAYPWISATVYHYQLRRRAPSRVQGPCAYCKPDALRVSGLQALCGLQALACRRRFGPRRCCAPMLAQALCAHWNPGALRIPGFQVLCATANSGAVSFCGFRRRAPIEIRAPCAPLDFRHCVPMLAEALCAFSNSGAARRLKSGRLARPGSQALRPL